MTIIYKPLKIFNNNYFQAITNNDDISMWNEKKQNNYVFNLFVC